MLGPMRHGWGQDLPMATSKVLRNRLIGIDGRIALAGTKAIIILGKGSLMYGATAQKGGVIPLSAAVSFLALVRNASYLREFHHKFFIIYAVSMS